MTMLEPGTVPAPTFAPGVAITVERELHTHESRLTVQLDIGQVAVVSDAAQMREGYVEAVLGDAIDALRRSAIYALGLEAWRDEHMAEMEARFASEREALIRGLYTAVRNAPTVDAAALVLADEMEVARRD